MPGNYFDTFPRCSLFMNKCSCGVVLCLHEEIAVLEISQMFLCSKEKITPSEVLFTSLATKQKIKRKLSRDIDHRNRQNTTAFPTLGPRGHCKDTEKLTLCWQ